MDALVTLLVLGSAALHATWNALMKAGRDRLVAMCAIAGISSLLGGGLAALAPLPAAGAWPYLLGSAAIHQFYYVFLLGQYRAGDLSLVYPLARGSAPLLLLLVSAPLAGEVLHPAQRVGVLLLSHGIFFLALQRGVLRRTGLAPVAWATGTGVIIAGYTLVDGLGVRLAGNASAYIGWLFLLQGLPWVGVLAVLAWRQPWRVRRPQLVPGLIGGVCSMTAYGLVIWALSLGAIAPVAALRETSVLFAALIGVLWLGEPFGPRRIAAASLMAGGVALLNWPA